MIALGLAFLSALIAGTFFLVWRRIIHPLGLPVLAAGSFFYLYVFQPSLLLVTGAARFYLSDWQIAKALFVCALMYAAFLWGWLGARRRAFPEETMRWRYGSLYRRGLFLSLAGIALFTAFMQQSGGVLHFYSAPHGANGAWEQQTAWVYLGKLLVFPGLAMMLLATLRGRERPAWWIGIGGVAAVVLFHAVMTASRGTLFPLVATLGITFYLATRKLPTLRTVLIGGAAMAIAVIALVGYRPVLHLGEKDVEAPSFNDAVLSVAKVSENEMRAGVVHAEFIYTAGIVEAIDRSQDYDLGSNWLYLVTVHLIPRLLWPGKPYGWHVGMEVTDLPSYLGWSPTVGAAPSLVGDVYWQFGIFSVVFWFALGRFSRRLFDRAWYTTSPVWQIAYVLFFAFGLHLFAQEFGQLLKFYLYTVTPALFLIYGCRVRKRRYPTMRPLETR